MIVRTHFFTFLLFTWSFSVYSQYSVKGRVLSLPDKQPVAFANIGIVNAAIGTISDEDGSFSFRIPAQHDRDSVLFSALGYSKISIPVSELSENSGLTVFLKETTYELSEVVLTAERKKARNYRVGNRRYDGGSVYADTITAGSAMALFIHNKSAKGGLEFQYPVYVKEVQLRIVKNTFPEFKVRVRLLKADTLRGVPIPGEDIFNESVVVKSNIIDDWLKVDLSGYRIKIDEDFFLAFEWILETKDRVRLYDQFEKFRNENPEQVSLDFSYVDGQRVTYDNYQGHFYFGTSFGMSVGYSTLKSHICYYRLNSFGKWYRSPSALAATVVFSDQPSAKQEEKEEIYTDADLDVLPSFYLSTPLQYRVLEDSTVGHNPVIDHFYTRFIDPVTIEVHRNVNEFTFYARNISFYPYHLRLDFAKIFNLQPIVTSETYTVYPGFQKLLVLRIVDPSIEKYNYNLAVKQIVGDPETRADHEFPYLVPVGNQRRIVLISVDSTEKGMEYNRDIFKLNGRDTVFAMRKGMVTCAPKMDRLVDRLSDQQALEIRHADGTVMIYCHLDPVDVFVFAGETVYPGQPLGTINSNKEVSVQLCHPVTNGKVDELEIYYFLDQEEIGNYTKLPEGLVIDYPESIIVREMNENERKSYIRNRLFGKDRK